MKKIFAVAIIGIALISCKKSSNPGIGTNGVQATIAGTTSTFNVLVTGYTYIDRIDPTDSVVYLDLYAVDNTNAKVAKEFDLYLTSDAPFAVGAYADTAGQSLSYVFKKASFDYYGYFDPYNMFIEYYSAHEYSSPDIINITAITSSSISGTFQGPIYIDGDSTKLSKAVTKGTFTASLTNYPYY
jgi:hypothetical protein